MFDGSEDHAISIELAQAYIRRWREGAPKGATQAVFFGRKAVDLLLSHGKCVGLRMYHARHPDGHDTMVLVAVDTEGNDLWQDGVAEEARPYPPWCAAPNPLNS